MGPADGTDGTDRRKAASTTQTWYTQKSTAADTTQRSQHKQKAKVTYPKNIVYFPEKKTEENKARHRLAHTWCAPDKLELSLIHI